MTMTSPGRAPFNELANLLGKLDPTALQTAVGSFPQFSEEVLKGADAGSGDGTRLSVLERAKFATELSDEIISSAKGASAGILKKASLLEAAKFTIVVAGGLFGAGTLASIGMSSDVVTKASTIATSIIAVLNSVVSYGSKKYSASKIKQAADLKKAAYALSILGNQLKSAVSADLPTEQIVEIMERCNKVALDVNKDSDLLPHS